MNKQDVVIGLFDTHSQAEHAVRRLGDSGIDLKTISIIGKDYAPEEHVVGFASPGSQAKYYGKFGAVWGGLIGMLFGSALMFIPVVGHIIVLGPLASMLITGAEGAVLGAGAGALGGAISMLGVPKDSVIRYESALKADHFLVSVQGSETALQRASDILRAAGGYEVTIYPRLT